MNTKNNKIDRRPKSAARQPMAKLDFSKVEHTVRADKPSRPREDEKERRSRLLDSRIGTLRMPAVRGLAGVFIMPFSGVMRGDGQLSIVEFFDPSQLAKPLVSSVRMGYYLRSLEKPQDAHVAGIVYTTSTTTRIQIVDLKTGRASISMTVPQLTNTPRAALAALKRVTGVEFKYGRLQEMPVAPVSTDQATDAMDTATKAEIPALVRLGFEREAGVLEAVLIDDCAMASLNESGLEVCSKATVTSSFIVPGSTGGTKSPEPLAMAALKEVELAAPAVAPSVPPPLPPMVVEDTPTPPAESVARVLEGVEVESDIGRPVLPEAIAEELAAQPDVVMEGSDIPPALAETMTSDRDFWEELLSSPDPHTPESAAVRVMEHYAVKFGIDAGDLSDFHAQHEPELASAMDTLGLLTTPEALVAASKALHFHKMLRSINVPVSG